MIFPGCFPFALSNSCSVKFANFIGLCASSPGFSNTFITNQICLIPVSRYTFAPVLLCYLSRKAEGMALWSLGNLSKMRKVPTPIPDKKCRERDKSDPCSKYLHHISKLFWSYRRSFFISLPWIESFVMEANTVCRILNNQLNFFSLMKANLI